MTFARAGLGTLVATAMLGLGAAAAGGATSPQTLFRQRLLDDPRTSPGIVALLDGGGFVERRVLVADLTGDGRADAVVSVSSGGAAGTVAFYVFSADPAGSGRGGGAEGLRALYRNQTLYRGRVRLADGAVAWQAGQYALGDPVCCPSAVVEHSVRWDADRSAFTER